MASRKLFHITAIFFTFSVLCAAQFRKSASEGFYKCFVQQACNCGQYSRWKDCYSALGEETLHVMYDEYNKCLTGEPMGYDSYKGMVDKFCNTPEDIRNPCYNQVNDKLKDIVKKTAMGLFGLEEATALEKTRKYLEPIMAFCIASPTECISDG